MRINWFSPLPPAQTGIAEYTKCVLPYLSRYAEVFLWTDRQKWDSDLGKYADVRHYELTNIPWFDINQADLNIYHIGNNPEFHYPIWRISQQCSGLVVLHDFRLQHFFSGIYRDQKRDRDTYVSHMKGYYGVEGEQIAQKFWDGALTAESIIESYPLTNLALENAIGVVTHTKEAFNTLEQENRWFVGYAPLPYINKCQVQTNNKVISTPYRIVIFGYIGSNRCLEAFLKALSTFNEKEMFRLDVYGQLWNQEYIHHKIQELGLTNLVKIHGFVKETKLDFALENAHLAVNLRYPSMGEASASQLKIWSNALPSLVTQIDWYAEQPENTVAFVRPEYEIEDIQQHLRNFIANPEYFMQLGKNGQKLLQEQHHPENYARAVIKFASKVKKYRRYPTAYNLVEKVGLDLSNWMNYEILDTQIQRTAEAINFITS